MRDASEQVRLSLERQATTFCHVWKILRKDGARFGFTDHDEALSFDDVTFAPSSGAEASDNESMIGFAAGGGELVAALDGESLDAEALTNGRFDGATVETWLVDWSNVESRLLLDVHALGEVRRAGGVFAAELRGLSHRLDETRGRLFRAACAADFGDGRCGVDPAAWTVQGVVSSVDSDGAIRAALGEWPAGHFASGRLVFTTGRHAGLARSLRSHGREGADHLLSLWTDLSPPLSPGDAFLVTAGCDKSFATCRDRFANAVNFRGCPHMPGNDFVMTYPSSSDASLDGGLAR